MSDQANESAVGVSTEGDVVVVRLDDGKANALSHDIIAALSAALDEAQAKAVAIIGREGKFSAGFDLSVMTSGPQQARDLLQAGANLAMQAYLSPVPVVFGVTGHALAMGAILCSAADYRVGAEGQFKLGLNEVGIGMHVPRFAVVPLAEVPDRAIEVATGLAARVHPGPFRVTRTNIRGALAARVTAELHQDLAEFSVGG